MEEERLNVVDEWKPIEISKQETYKIRIKGTKPLLMHNPSSISDKPTMRRGEHLEPKEEAEMHLYKDNTDKICIPSTNIKACIRNAGRNYKVSGKKATFGSVIRAGIDIFPFPTVPLIYNNNWKADIRSVVIQRSRILRSRPRFDDWGLEFEIVNNDPTVIHKDILEKIVSDGGKYYGLGDFRPEFGLFKVEEFNIKED